MKNFGKTTDDAFKVYIGEDFYLKYLRHWCADHMFSKQSIHILSPMPCSGRNVKLPVLCSKLQCNVSAQNTGVVFLILVISEVVVAFPYP